MAGSFQSFEVSDLALGKPALHWLPTSATVDDALKALKEFNVKEISVWKCSTDSDAVSASVRSRTSLSGVNGGIDCGEPRCVGKVNVLDVICYLAREECLRKYENAVQEPVSVLLAATTNLVKRVNSRTRLCDAFSLVLEGAQFLVVPLDSPQFKNSKHTSQAYRKLGHSALKSSVSAAGALVSKKTHHRSYCWLTQEDVLRFLLGWIGMFSSLSMKSIENLGIINTDYLFVEASAKATTALPLMHQASQSLSAVAVVEGSSTFQQVKDEVLGPKLVGEISLSTLKNCDQSAALALATFSVEEFLSFTQRGSFSKGSKNLAKFRLRQKMLAVNLFPAYATDDVTSDCSSQEAYANDSSTDESSDESFDESPSSMLPKKSWSIPRGHAPPITCRPWNSLVAVMAQALAHRTSYMWVTDNDRTLIGIVTYYDIIHVLLNHLESSE